MTQPAATERPQHRVWANHSGVSKGWPRGGAVANAPGGIRRGWRKTASPKIFYDQRAQK